MTVVSKELFERAVSSSTNCYHFGHPWHQQCIPANLIMYKDAFIGSLKFYAIVYVAQIIMRGKKMRYKRERLKMLHYFIRSTIFGTCVTSLVCTSQCLSWRLLGGKTYNTYILIPTFISGFFIFLEPSERRSLVINLFCNLYIEYWLKCLQRAGFISLGKFKQTLCFMMGSAALFYLMRLEGDKEGRTSLFWLFTPEKVRRKPETDKPCPHDGSCLTHIFNGFSKLFGVGLAISLARHLLPAIFRAPIKTLATIRPRHFKMAASFGCYIGIYRAVICYLCRRTGQDSALFALPAGFLSGASFAFNPSLGISIAAVTAACKLYTTILYEQGVLPKSLPLPEILYSICMAGLFHARFMDPDPCPKYILNLMKTMSNGRTDQLYGNMLEAIKSVS